jgi:hypothetical protein
LLVATAAASFAGKFLFYLQNRVANLGFLLAVVGGV